MYLEVSSLTDRAIKCLRKQEALIVSCAPTNYFNGTRLHGIDVKSSKQKYLANFGKTSCYYNSQINIRSYIRVLGLNYCILQRKKGGYDCSHRRRNHFYNNPSWNTLGIPYLEREISLDGSPVFNSTPRQSGGGGRRAQRFLSRASERRARRPPDSGVVRRNGGALEEGDSQRHNLSTWKTTGEVWAAAREWLAFCEPPRPIKSTWFPNPPPAPILSQAARHPRRAGGDTAS